MKREIRFALMSQQICKIGCWMFCSRGLVGGQHQIVWAKVKELTKCSLINVFVYQNWRVTHLKQLDLPQINLMNFKVEYVRPRSGQASDEVARGQLVSLDGFSFAFRAKNEEWCDLQLVSQITFGRPWLNSGKNQFQSCFWVAKIGINQVGKVLCPAGTE